MWRIWQLCLYVYSATLQNRIEDKHMNVLMLKLLDASLLLNYVGGLYLFFLFQGYFFVVVILLYLVSLQIIVMKSYSAPEQLQNSVFKNVRLILASFG